MYRFNGWRVKILGVYFSDNKKIEQEQNFLNQIVEILRIFFMETKKFNYRRDNFCF